jgi:hypothetical protein
MKVDLNRIKAALQQLEQNPNSGDRIFTTSQDSTAENPVVDTTSTPNPTSSAPIPPLQPNRKVPTLPTFDSLDTNNSLSSEENALDPNLFPTNPPPTPLMQEIEQVIQQIENLYQEGPIVDGWLESYPCESTLNNDQRFVNDVVTPLEYVKAAGDLDRDKVICETPRSCYRLNGVSGTNQQWSYPCPIEQLPSVSIAIARYEKLIQLLDRKRELETQLEQL